MAAAGVVLGIISVLTRSGPLAVLAAFLVGWCALSGLALAWRAHLEAAGSRVRGARLTREITPGIAPFGTTARVALALEGGAWAGVPQTREQVPRALLPVLPGRGFYEVTASRRGVWDIGPAAARRLDAAGLWQVTYALGGTNALVVWPKVDKLPRRTFASLAVEAGGPAHAGVPRARLDDMTLRHYRPGDDLRRIHWKASGRRDQLLVRAAEPTQPSTMTVVVLAPGETDGAAEVGEWLLSAAASVSVAAFAAGNRVRLIVGTQIACDSREDALNSLAAVELPANRAVARDWAQLTALALAEVGELGACLLVTGITPPDHLLAQLRRYDPVWIVTAGLPAEVVSHARASVPTARGHAAANVDDAIAETLSRAMNVPRRGV